ncbi:MAG: hypothetical protein K0041_08960 [Acidithiobacillus sp.]|nr:hypothetical protein [Acidithiobacillus sp.]
MHDLKILAVAFGASLAATIVVAVLLRIAGKKPNRLNIVAIPIGITVAEAARLQWQISGVVFPFVLGAAVGLAVFWAQYLKAKHGV